MSSVSSRVVAVHGNLFLVLTEAGENLLPKAGRVVEVPVVGDFVEVRSGVIELVLPRRSEVRRREPGRSHRIQVLAANVDVLVIVIGLDHDFDLRRLERYVVLAYESGATPLICLTKADLCADAEVRRELVRARDRRVEVILSSALDGKGAEEIRKVIRPGLTAALLGSSGAGKSTLVNLLLGQERQAVNEVRAGDSRGRHTTTHRQMFEIPGGGWLIDQPGLREVGIVADEELVNDAFPEIAERGAQCRFRDCRHESEPGCAVREQVDPDQLKSFRKLRREAQRAAEELDPVAQVRRKAKIKAVHRAMRDMYRE